MLSTLKTTAVISVSQPRTFSRLLAVLSFVNGAVFALLWACFLFDQATSQGFTTVTIIAIVLIQSWVRVIYEK